MLAEKVAPKLQAAGVELGDLVIEGEIYNNPSFFEGFSKKAGPVLIGVGLLSILLSLVGLNLRILVWIDAWGAGVGWALRGGVVALGVAFVLLNRTIKRE